VVSLDPICGGLSFFRRLLLFGLEFCSRLAQIYYPYNGMQKSPFSRKSVLVLSFGTGGLVCLLAARGSVVVVGKTYVLQRFR